ncbi:MAG: hypothetical protein NVS2B14_19340 [Chamaesiphon sp.]
MRLLPGFEDSSFPFPSPKFRIGQQVYWDYIFDDDIGPRSGELHQYWGVILGMIFHPDTGRWRYWVRWIGWYPPRLIPSSFTPYDEEAAEDELRAVRLKVE